MQNSAEPIAIKLHGIKPIIEIHEYSFYYFLVLLVVGSILFLSLAYLSYNYFKHRNKFNIRKEHFKLLEAIAFEDAKSDAYAITEYGLTFRDDTQKHFDTYELLVSDLEAYKYKQNVEEFNEETKRLFENFVGMIDV